MGHTYIIVPNCTIKKEFWLMTKTLILQLLCLYLTVIWYGALDMFSVKLYTITKEKRSTKPHKKII